ncbi:hypothetical protein WH47_03745 [Habropoda laboriosa]|uniref:Uncharacterized protein n=1 Tax=Habropoda laboriosa TaxID=597456 RepID=A0A0L7QW22_9HYME|nr:hypothetical protein WH47_03745 [Habropoda laboriosa]
MGRCGHDGRPINAARCSKSRIHQGDPEDNANSGYFAPRLGDTSSPRTGGWTSERESMEQSRAAACCPHQAPLRIFHREFTSLDTTGKLQEWRSNLSLLASVGSLFFSQVPSSLEYPSALSVARARAVLRPRKRSLFLTGTTVNRRKFLQPQPQHAR